MGPAWGMTLKIKPRFGPQKGRQSGTFGGNVAV